MSVLDTKEQSVRDKKLPSALQNFAQNECAFQYWPSVQLKMNKDTEQNQNSKMETTLYKLEVHS